jgi:ApeA N-terminal domain 1
VEAFDDEGVFWLPGKKADQRTGRLTFDPAEGATLTITGVFGDIDEQSNDQTRMRRVHGTTGRRHLTLDGCFNTGTNFETSGVPSQSYYVSRVITDALFDESEDLAFDKCSVTFDQLARWINRPGFKVNFQSQTPQLTFPPDRVTIEFERPPDETVEIDSQEELTLTSKWSVGGDYITKTSLDQGTYLELKYPAAQSLDKMLGDVKYLQDLLTLATNGPTAPLEITLWRAGKEMKYYAGQLAERVRLDAPQSAGRILFELSDIGGLPTIARWVSIAREYHIVVGSLLSIRYASGLYIENRFNNVISAAETFHRARFLNQVRPKAEFRRFCRELVAAVPQESQEWLRAQIQHANEPRLRDRLTEMAAYAGDAFAAVYDEPEPWVRVVTEIDLRITTRGARCRSRRAICMSLLNRFSCL